MNATAAKPDRLTAPGSYAGTVGAAVLGTNKDGTKPCLSLRVDCSDGCAWVDLWLTPAGRPWALKKLRALGAGEDCLTDPAPLVGRACNVEVKLDGDRVRADLPLAADPLEASDRAELCRRVDFLAILDAAGVAVTPKGTGSWTCKLRPERTASARVWSPGHGKNGAAGWTWYDYGSGEGGDALAFLTDLQGLTFLEACKDLCNRTGYWPKGWDLEAHQTTAAPVPVPLKLAGPPPPPAVVPLDASEQIEATVDLLLALMELYPEAVRAGDAYLAERGVLWPGGPGAAALRLPSEVCDPLASMLEKNNRDRHLRAGHLKEKNGKTRLAWWGDCVLFPCRNEDGAPLYLIARRLDWKPGDRFGKYINQPTAAGAVRCAYNLPALYQCAGQKPMGRLQWQTLDPVRGRDLLLVEGALDALGAGALGWPAVALLSRPEARGWTDTGAAAAMLEEHAPALRDCDRVLVVPDADEGEKGRVGIEKAAGLVAWLRGVGARAELATLTDLCGPLPEGVKDFADLSKHKGTAKHENA